MEISRDQLVTVISSGNDAVDNRLILDTDGMFQLIPLNCFDDNCSYVIRWETFDAGNDYVGKAASGDNRHIDDIMCLAQKAWKKYHETGKTRILNPNI